MRFAKIIASIFMIIGPIAVAQEPIAEDPAAAIQTVQNATAEDRASESKISESKIGKRDATEPPPALPTRWLLLCCGLPGDADHRERLTAACEKIIAAAEPILGVPPERLRVLAGDQEMRDAIADQANSVGVCTKESVSGAIQALCDQVKPGDACWVMLLGHAHLYGSASKFNVLGADFDQTEFAAWSKPLACSEQVFWITMPVSGFWIKPLSGHSRVVISATEPDLEVTGTEMPYALADIFTGDHEQQELEDVDQDGSLSLLDLYLAANLEIHGRFASMERLQTEHAQLEDNGDGRGSEVQLAYLPVDKDEETPEANAEADSTDEAKPTDQAAPGVEPPKPISNENLDGYRSRQILINATTNEATFSSHPTDET